MINKRIHLLFFLMLLCFLCVITYKVHISPVEALSGSFTIGIIADQTYEGQAITPQPGVKFNNTNLTKDTDYSLSYKNNNKIGTATIVVTGKGTYKGITGTRDFVIKGKIIYKANGGVGNDVVQEVKYNDSVNLKAYTIFENEKYVNGCWNTKADGTGEDWKIDEINGGKWKWNREDNLVLYAKWRHIRVIYDANGGYATTGSGEDTDTYTSWYDEVPLDGKYYLKNNFYNRKGYSFVGWNYKKDGTGTDWTKWYYDNFIKTGLNYWLWDYNSYKNDVTLYAIWKLIDYRIRYDANGGEGEMEDTIVNYKKDYVLRANTFTKEGYYFIGWKDLSGQIWQNQYGDTWELDNGQNGIANNVLTLKAMWRANDAEPDPIEGNVVRVSFGESAFLLSYRCGYQDYTILDKNRGGKDDNSPLATGDYFVYNGNEYRVAVEGEINGDNKVNVNDMATIYSQMKLLDQGEQIKLNEYQFAAADLDNNNKLNINDIQILYRIARKNK